MSFMKYVTTPRFTILDQFLLLLVLAVAEILGTNDAHKVLIGIVLIVPASLLSVLLERHYHEKD